MLTTPTLALPFFAAAAAVLIWAAVSDVRRYLIPNAASLLLAGLFVAYALSIRTVAPLPGHALAGAAAFAAGAGFFRLGVMGGGDVKLFAATALWAGPSHIADLLLMTTLAGGLLGVAVLIARRLSGRAAPSPSGVASVPALRARLPYGVAIAAGGLWVLLVLAAGPAAA